MASSASAILKAFEDRLPAPLARRFGTPAAAAWTAIFVLIAAFGLINYGVGLLLDAVLHPAAEPVPIESYGEPQGRPAGYKGEIEVRVLPANDRVAIEVIDNGIGLPKQNRAKLLEPYVTTRAKGTGLGLAIVQKVVEQHGGALTLEDAPHTKTRTRGALIRMTLPIKFEIANDVSTEQLHNASHAASGA